MSPRVRVGRCSRCKLVVYTYENLVWSKRVRKSDTGGLEMYHEVAHAKCPTFRPVTGPGPIAFVRDDPLATIYFGGGSRDRPTLKEWLICIGIVAVLSGLTWLGLEAVRAFS